MRSRARRGSNWRSRRGGNNGYNVPLLVNVQPAGTYLGEDYYRAGGLTGGVERIAASGPFARRRPDDQRQDRGRECKRAIVCDPDVIRPYAKPLKEKAGFKVLSGNLFESAIMKISVISQEFCDRYLSNPDDPNAFEGKAVVLTDPRITTSGSTTPRLKIDERTILVMRGTGPIGYPGSGEVVNMRPPAALISKGVTSLPCIGDGRQSGTSASPSIVNASPEAAAGGGLALLRSGDRVRVDLNGGKVDMLVRPTSLPNDPKHLLRKAMSFPQAETPWQDIQRTLVEQLSDGMVLRTAVKYRRVAQSSIPRDSH